MHRGAPAVCRSNRHNIVCPDFQSIENIARASLFPLRRRSGPRALQTRVSSAMSRMSLPLISESGRPRRSTRPRGITFSSSLSGCRPKNLTCSVQRRMFCLACGSINATAACLNVLSAIAFVFLLLKLPLGHHVVLAGPPHDGARRRAPLPPPASAAHPSPVFFGFPTTEVDRAEHQLRCSTVWAPETKLLTPRARWSHNKI